MGSFRLVGQTNENARDGAEPSKFHLLRLTVELGPSLGSKMLKKKVEQRRPDGKQSWRRGSWLPRALDRGDHEDQRVNTLRGEA